MSNDALFGYLRHRCHELCREHCFESCHHQVCNLFVCCLVLFLTRTLFNRLRREEESLDNIGQYWVQCETEELKYNAIANIYGVVTIGQAMIFCQTRKTASWLVEKMTKDGHAVALLSGELSVEDRIQVLDRFRDGLEKILITTNVMSRGIDIEQGELST